MPQSASANRYAQAVFQIAVDRDELDVWSADLQTLVGALDVEGFALLLDAPQVPVVHKVEAINRAVGDSVAALSANLLSLLASKNLAHLLTDVLDEYSKMIDFQLGIEVAQVTTATTLNQVQRQRVTDILETIMAKKVRIHTLVDTEILGGIVVRVGDRVIDGSVRARLREMRREIVDTLPAS